MARYRSVLFCTFLLVLSILPGALTAGVFTVTNSDPSGPGSLAQAVADANSAPPGPHQIVFAIPGPGVHKIDLSSGGLVLGSAITIDGYTQPGASPNTLGVGDNAVVLIQLDGGGPYVALSPAIMINGDNCVIRGLSITGFYNPSSESFGGAITTSGSETSGNNNRIEGNFIGLSPDGITLSGNSIGVALWSSQAQGNVVGGEDPATRNIISGNNTGVLGAANGMILGNYFGTDAAGSGQGYGNYYGIRTGDDVVIGSDAPGGGNVITGSYLGIWGGARNVIRGNIIGPNADGSPSFGNFYGVTVVDGSFVGGMNASQGNVIAFNVYGAVVGSFGFSGGSSILSNLFFANIANDIDLLGDGPTPNDYLDQDSGPNQLQNFPVVVSVARTSEQTVVSGGLNSRPSTAYTLQFFAQDATAQRLLGTQTVTTNNVGDAPFQFTFPISTTPDDFITATATSPNGDTSEFFPHQGRVDLANISTRGNINPGENTLIGGFFLEPGNPRTLLIRALGPSLNVGGALPDPRLELKAANGDTIGTNENWTDSQAQEILNTGLPPGNPNEAALLVQLDPASTGPFYTVLVTDATGGSGIGTVEVYALGVGAEYGQKFRNISTRGYVGTGDDALIGGTILQGSAGAELVIRAIGPDLASAGVNDSLQDPILELRDAEGNILASNDNWRTDQEQEIIATGLAPQDDRDSAILTSLFPTSYTAIVRGKNNTTGIALVEIYQLTAESTRPVPNLH